MDRIWPKLRELDLADIEISFAVFREFLSLHAEGLRYIRLGAINLEADNNLQYIWIELFKFIKDSLKLVEISLLPGYFTESTDVNFNSQAELKLECGGNITVDDIARYLVCELKPAATLEGSVIRDGILQSLTWDDLLLAYY